MLAGDPPFGPGVVQASPDSKILTLTVPIRGDAVSSQDVAAVLSLRQRLIPPAFAGSGAHVYAGGKTADEADYFHAVTSPTPYVLAFVLGLSFLLLLLAFRSLTIAAVSILLNLLSAGAAYGLLTLVFIHGAGAGIFGFQQVPVIDAWVPLFMFSVLYALSMDYQVFLMSRIKERYDQCGSTREAVAGGVASTARIITGAALIIVAVFAGFARGQLLQFQEMGFGVAAALILDATLIRLVILPSTLSLLGQRSWYLPHWLHWLPHPQAEPPQAPSTENPVTVEAPNPYDGRSQAMADAGFTHAAGADIPHSATSRRGMLPALAGLVVGLAYAAISVYWAVGGRWLLNTVGILPSQPGQAGHLAALLAVWGAAGVKAVAAVLPLLAIGVWPRTANGGLRRLARVLTWIEAAILVSYGLVLTASGLLVQAGVIKAAGHADRLAQEWHAYLWDPWFLIWGIFVFLALWRSRPASQDHLPGAP